MLVARDVTYEPTADDVLWLRRAVEQEGRPRELVAQTLVNGFMWARSELGSKMTLAQYVRAYAQPVNPLWMPGGKRYEEALAAAKSDEQRARIEAQGAERKLVFATRDHFTAATMKAVERALAAPPRIPGATDYARWDIEHDEPWTAFTPRTEGANRFWARPGAIGWTGYGVAAFAADPRTSSLAAALLVGLAIFVFMRGARRT